MNYFDKVENKHRIITIDKRPEYDTEKISLLRHNELFPNGQFTERIKEMIGDTEPSGYFDMVKERNNKIKGLLFSTWKMYSKSEDGDEVAIRYIFPYKYNESNEYLFYLESPIYNNFYHINGLTESSADINNDNSWSRFRLVFREVDFSEMVEHSKMKCEEAAIVRLTKLIERDKLID